ncbi:MAG: hypothetical protein QM537_07055 [Candidatus Symbiobacter sp.]|nr:hypothetical protein [Candidatus Symbiobacter sp.]
MKKFKDSHWAAIHELATMLHHAGKLNDDDMRGYDELCLAGDKGGKLRTDQKSVTVKSRQKHDNADNATWAA